MSTSTGTNGSAQGPARLTGPSMWIPCLVMAVCTGLAFFDRQALSLLAPTILEEFDMSTTDFGIVASFFFLAYTVGNPVWGTFLDHIGLRIGMLAGVALWTAGSVSHILMASVLGFAMARAVLGFGEGATFPGGLKTAVESLPSDRRALGMAVSFSGGTLGGTLAALILVPIGVAYGWRTSFVFTGLLGAAWIILWIVVSRPPYLPKTERKETKIVLPNPFERRFWALVFSYALPAISPGPILTIIPLYFTGGLGVSQPGLASYMWAPPLAWGVGYFVWGWVADRYTTDNPRPVGLFSILIVCSLTFGLTTLTTSAVIATVLICFSAFIAGGFQMVALKASSYSFPREHAGKMMGIASGSWSLANAAILPILGLLFDQQNYGIAFWLIAICPLVGILGWMWLNRESKREQELIDPRIILGFSGAALGGLVGFLLRPEVPILGKLPFGTVVTRGAYLQRTDELIRSVAETSFNYLFLAVVFGTVAGFILGNIRRGKT